MDADSLWMKGHSCLYEGKYKKAVNYYDKAIEIYSPNDPVDLKMIFSERGEAKFYMGDYHGAIADFDYIMTKNGKLGPGLLFTRGLAKAHLNDENGSWNDIKLYVQSRLRDNEKWPNIIDGDRKILGGELKNDNALVRLVTLKGLGLLGTHAKKSLRSLKIARKKEKDERVIREMDRVIEMLEKETS